MVKRIFTGILGVTPIAVNPLFTVSDWKIEAPAKAAIRKREWVSENPETHDEHERYVSASETLTGQGGGGIAVPFVHPAVHNQAAIHAHYDKDAVIYRIAALTARPSYVHV